MKYIIVILSVFTVSCGSHLKKVQKTSAIESISEQTIDKTQETIYRDLDTIISIKGSGVSVQLIQSDLQSVDSIVTRTVKQGNLTVRASYNKNTKEFTASAIKDSENIPIIVHEVIKRDKDITSNIKRDSEIKTVNKDIQNQSGVDWNKVFIWLGTIFGCLVFIFALIKYRK